MHVTDRAFRAQKVPLKKYGKSQVELDKIAVDNKAIQNMLKTKERAVKVEYQNLCREAAQKNRKAASKHPWCSKHDTE